MMPRDSCYKPSLGQIIERKGKVFRTSWFVTSPPAMTVYVFTYLYMYAYIKFIKNPHHGDCQI